MSAYELKLCPFCGRECRVFMNWSHGERGKRMAFEAWNKRV